MSHTSPTTYLAWSILTVLLGAFLLFHLWKFDRFKCLRWNQGAGTGAFKRIMTYTYIITVPSIMSFAIGFAYIKYKVGYSFIPGHGIIPTPWQLWPHAYQRAIFPLQLMFSISFSLEMVTHLEELCFWLFLVNAGQIQQDWFRSLYFKTWVGGSVVAAIYMPLVTIFTRSDPLRCEAFSFLAGSLGSLSLTLWFTPILWTFPRFLRDLQREGVDMSTIVRLTTFYELNSIRVVFRFLFCVPLLVLGIDGVTPHQHVNSSSFWTEILAITAGIGCVVSSGITLVIFFPRSVESEINNRQASKVNHRSQAYNTLNTYRETVYSDAPPPHPDHEPQTLDYNYTSDNRNRHGDRKYTPPANVNQTTMNTTQSRGAITSLSSADAPEYADDIKMSAFPTPDPDQTSDEVADRVLSIPPSVMRFAPNRRTMGGGTVEGKVMMMKLTESNLAKHESHVGSVHPFARNFVSPIDLIQTPAEDNQPSYHGRREMRWRAV